VNVHWFWLPVVWFFEIVFVCGLALLTSALNVFIRDTRYVVESVNTILFWLVPIFYASVPEKYTDFYEVNPLAALVISLRKILLENHAPLTPTLLKLMAVSFTIFVAGFFTFRRMKPHFYERI
jgi:lipopolysaccharide transport system permease protein